MKLGDFADIKHGFAFKGEYFSEKDNGIVLVTPGNFKIGGGFQESECRFYTGEYSDEYVLSAGDLIVTMTDLSKKADTLGYGAIIPTSARVYLHNQRIGLITFKKTGLLKKYLRWYMQTEDYRQYIVSTSTGSTVHHTSPGRILDSKIIVPSIEQQSKFIAIAEQSDKSKFAALGISNLNVVKHLFLSR